MDDVIQAQIDKTYRELNQIKKTVEKSRVSKTSNGYIFLIAWSNASLLRILNKKFTDSLPKLLYRLKSQSDDACRSVVANIEEGFARQTTEEYIKFLGFSRASLIEVKGDVQRSLQDRILKSVKNSSLELIGINLADWHKILSESVAFKGDYRKVEEYTEKIKVDNLTYEVFMELINKTDWNIRKLVESLEKKLNQDQKFYQVEKIKLNKFI